MMKEKKAESIVSTVEKFEKFVNVGKSKNKIEEVRRLFHID
jgi:hypothetical protein